MSWFDEQLRTRKEADDRGLEDSIQSIARAVMGQKLSDALSRGERAQTAVEEILKYYHYKPRELPESLRHAALEEQLEYRLRPFGIMYRSVSLDSGWYRRACGPRIGILAEDNAAVVLLPGSLRGYYFYDPKTGKRKWLNRQTEKLLDEEAVCFYRPLPQKALTMLDLLR